MTPAPALRVAFIVTHPVQYYVPLYRRLAARPGFAVRVFFTWHGGDATHDPEFGRTVAWDVPLRDGYDVEVVPNTARDPGSHRFGGIRNPGLAARVLAWRPDAVVLTGYAYASHLAALWKLSRAGVPVLFRGDSHLLGRGQDRWWFAKRLLLRAVYARCAKVLWVGTHNRRYFEACGVPAGKLAPCPHTIDTARFLEPDAAHEAAARAWRRELGIADDACVVLFAGKFSAVKRPLEFIDAALAADDPRLVLVLAGDGPLRADVERRAAAAPGRVRVLPFQNQSRMPVVYRLGDLVALPSAGETWGLAVNEALACGRPVLVSDRVGCAADLVREGANGFVFPHADWARCTKLLREAAAAPERLAALRTQARAGAAAFDTVAAESALVAALADFAPRTTP